MRCRRTRACACLLALLLLPMCALAQTAVELPDIGVRFYLNDEACLCVTRDNLADQAAALQAMGLAVGTVRDMLQREDAHLLIFAESGAQLLLQTSQKPSDIRANDVGSMTARERETFLQAVAGEGHFSDASWPENANGFALFAHILPANAASAMDAVAASTLYRGAVYTLRMDVIGRAATEADERLVLSAAQRFLRLNGALRQTVAEGDALTLPAVPAVASGAAEVTATATDVALTLDPVPSHLPVTSVTLSGLTEPKAALRYTLGDQPSSRFYADAEGRFSIHINDLVGNADNLIALSATKEQRTASVSFSVYVDWQDTPLALSCTAATAEGEKYLLHGLALPGAKVQMLRKSRTIDLKVKDDGSFTCNVTLNANGDTSFIIRALADGYRGTDAPVSLFHAVPNAQEVQRLERNVTELRYSRLTEKPDRYAERLLKLTGAVKALGQANGEPCYLLITEAGDGYLIECQSLTDVQLEQSIQALATTAGENAAFESAWAIGSFPLLRETYRYGLYE